MELGADGLETARIRLDPLSEADREEVLANGSIADMWKSMPVIASGTTGEAYFNHTLRMAELGTGLGMAARLRGENSISGLAAFLLPNRLHRRTRIGYIWIRPDQRGAGLTAHIHYLMLRRAMEWRARRVEWWIATRNQIALETVERIGALREGVLRHHSRFADGCWADIAVLSLVDEEIRAAMKQLGERIGEGVAASGA